MLLTSPISFPNLGITVDPSPVAFTVMGKDIYWYGIIIAGGFLLAVLYMLYRAKTFGITQDDVLDLVLWAVPIGVVCARLYYCVFYWDLYRDNPISMLYIWEGGLAIYGGIIGGAITVLVLSRVKKIPTLVMLDDAAMGVIIGQILGRWGNFMNREAHGSVTDTFFKMGLVDAAGKVTYYHPTFLYESVWNLVGFIGLHFHQSPHEKTVSFGNFFLHFTTVGGQFDPNLIERFTGNIYRVFGQLFTIGFVEKCVESSFVHEDGFLLQSGSELIVIAFVFFVDQIDNFGVKIGIDIVVVYFKQCSE